MVYYQCDWTQYSFDEAMLSKLKMLNVTLRFQKEYVLF